MKLPYRSRQISLGVSVVLCCYQNYWAFLYFLLPKYCWIAQRSTWLVPWEFCSEQNYRHLSMSVSLQNDFLHFTIFQRRFALNHMFSLPVLIVGLYDVHPVFRGCHIMRTTARSRFGSRTQKGWFSPLVLYSRTHASHDENHRPYHVSVPMSNTTIKNHSSIIYILNQYSQRTMKLHQSTAAQPTTDNTSFGT